MSTRLNLLTEWARLVAASLAAAGVRDVVVSPGSRSTPFALALAEHEALRTTSVIDERVAAFVALGMGRATGRPAAVLATSGSAPAHWFPAVVEASMANVPLLLLSADRPLALTHSGAAQTIDQTKLFGGAVRFFADLGDPRDDDASLEGVTRTIAQAVARTRGERGGPVHLNLRADKPLEPVLLSDDLHARVARCIARGLTSISTSAPAGDEDFARALGEALGKSARPLVVVGPRATTAPPIAAHLARLGVPVAGEASSQLRFGERTPLAVDAFDLLFSSATFAAKHRPDLVLQIGSLPTASAFASFTDVRRFVLDPCDVHDALGGAEALSTSDAAATLALVASHRDAEPRHATYAASLVTADALAWGEVERALDARPFGEGAAVCAAFAAVPEGALLSIGNSLPIRTLDRYVRGAARGVTVLSQRGANGIDGLVAGAIGAGLATRRPVLAIVGDVSLLHDAGALLTLATVRTPVVVVVIENAGGRIFEELPIANDPSLASRMPLFTTPYDVDLRALAAAYRVPCGEARSSAEVRSAVARGLGCEGGSLVLATVPPTDARDSLRWLRRAVAEVLA